MKKDDFIFGYYPVLEALQAGATLDKIFIHQGSEAHRFESIIKIAGARDIPVNLVPLVKLDKLTRSNHQGIVAYLSPISFIPLEGLLRLKNNRNPRVFSLF